MTPKKTPRPKPRKNPNRLSRRSAAKTDKSQTCLHCRFWSMWDHHCTMQALGADNWQPVHPDTPACKEFQPE